MMSTEDEIVDLKAQIKSISSLYDILIQNNSKLRSENAKLQQTVLDFQSRYNESLEEIKRYRAALEFLKREYNGFVWRIADNALKEIE